MLPGEPHVTLRPKYRLRRGPETDSNHGIRPRRPHGRFAAGFAELQDPREDNTRHELNEIPVIALCAMLCGAEDCSDMALFGHAKEPFLRQFLHLRHGIPSDDTFSRVFRPATSPGYRSTTNGRLSPPSARLSVARD